jgi:hypothetical protein
MMIGANDVKMPPTYGGTPADRMAAASAYADAPTVTAATTADPDDETFLLSRPESMATAAPPESPPPAPVVSHHEMPTLPPVGVFAPVAGGKSTDVSTAKRTSFDPEPNDRRRRIIVIAIAAAVVLAIGLTIVLWPSSAPPVPVTSGQRTVLPVEGSIAAAAQLGR